MSTKSSEISSGLVAVAEVAFSLHLGLYAAFVGRRQIEVGDMLVRLSDAEAIIAQKDAEILEQCRINGMGAEREAALLGQVAQQSAALKLAKLTKERETRLDLAEQNKQLKAELKSIDGALDDPRANLTLTTSEIIWELKGQVEKLTKERDAEIARNRPLQSMIKSTEETKSFLLKKSEENKEAVKQLDSERQANALLTEELAALAEQNAKMRKAWVFYQEHKDELEKNNG